MAETNWVDKKCQETVWLTPPKIIERVEAYFGGPIPLDPATLPYNPTGAKKFFTEEDDGLARVWDYPSFLNPPYGKGIRNWCKKIHDEATKGQEIVGLLPCGARFSTRYWQEHIFNEWLRAICFVKGRVGFLLPDGTKASQNPYDSQILLFNGSPARFAVAFKPIGKVLIVARVV